MMMGSGVPAEDVAGGPAPHQPVLRAEAIDALRPRAGGLYFDGTLGAGGYARALLATPGTRVIGVDRDPSAAVFGQTLSAEFGDRFAFYPGRFGDLEAIATACGVTAVDGVVLDIGVSSMQLDRPDRGFSFRRDGPLDMRMEAEGPSAADLVNTTDESLLASILYRFGEERDSRRIARAIAADRTATPFLRTKQLADLVGRVVRKSTPGVHPATKTFQALRIAVNDELGQLHAGLAAAEQILAPGGVLAVVTFHSLEDRIVKRFLTRGAGRGGIGSRHLPEAPERHVPSFALPGGQPVSPSEAEVAANPRSRSAKLRIGIRTAAPALGLDPELHTLADLGLPPARR